MRRKFIFILVYEYGLRMAALRRISSPISTNFYYKRINTDGDFSNDVQRRSSPWVCPGTHVQSTTGIKYHWHVNRSFFPRSNAQIVRINTIETQTERGTTVSRLPINYHCHQSVVVDNCSVDCRCATWLQRMITKGRLVTLFTQLSVKEPQTIVGRENTKQG